MISSILSLLAGLLVAEASDSLQAVTVFADRGVVVSRTDTIHVDKSVTVTDAFSGIPGLYVSDYGGTAGSKYVSFRGLGSPHTAIYVDGVRVGNVQSGQTDLGMVDLGNLGNVVVDYAQNSISFNTARPVFDKRPVGGRAGIRGGSFGTYEPSARLDFRLPGNACLSATAGGVISKGNFSLPDGTVRVNNDIRQIRGGLDAWGNVADGDWHAKAYFNGADRGTPGTLDWPSTDRQKDRNAFLQGVMRKQFTPLYVVNISAKASYDDLVYLSDFGSNRYRQAEAQVNSSHKFSLCQWFDASLAADFQWDGLDSDLYKTARTSIFATATAVFHPKRFRADIALEYSGTFDRGGKARNILSPSADLRWNAFRGFDVVAFTRRAYRTPTFNELYYPGYGNPDLEAEDAWLSDIGIQYNRTAGRNWKVQAKVDGFFNFLKDKIVSAPTSFDPNIWLPYNIGIVQMSGADVYVGMGYERGGLKGTFSARYSFQNAIDKTPDSDSYGQQIPFISKHSVCISADAGYKCWSANLSWNWRGGRYDSVGKMPDYNTLDLTVGKDFNLPENLILSLKFIGRNLTDCRYELTGGYPMPGRSFYGEIDFKF